MFNNEIHENRLKILGKLTANFIHEIRNPLSVVRLNLSYLNMLEEKLPAEVCNSINNTSEAVDRIQNLLEILTGFTKKSQGDININLAEIIHNSVDLVKGNAKRFNMVLEKDINKNIPDISADKNKIIQVLLNLFTFVIDSSVQGSSIRIKSSAGKSKKIFIEIDSDGFNEKVNEKVKVYLESNKRKGKFSDLGICKTILEEYNADLQFEYNNKKISKFIIIFNTSSIREKNEL